MLETLKLLATLSSGLFAGAALYITLVEHPVRALLETRAAATQWAPSYKRATWMQAPLALAGLLAGVLVYALGGGLAWLIGALLLGAVVPVTFIVIMPVNHQLLAPGRDLDSAETRALLERWGHLHLLRTALSAIAFILFASMPYAT